MEDIEIRARRCVSGTIPGIFFIPFCPHAWWDFSCHFIASCIWISSWGGIDQAPFVLSTDHWTGKQVLDTGRDTFLSTGYWFLFFHWPIVCYPWDIPLVKTHRNVRLWGHHVNRVCSPQTHPNKRPIRESCSGGYVPDLKIQWFQEKARSGSNPCSKQST